MIPSSAGSSLVQLLELHDPDVVAVLPGKHQIHRAAQEKLFLFDILRSVSHNMTLSLLEEIAQTSDGIRAGTSSKYRGREKVLVTAIAFGSIAHRA